jgi:hypothetical protein
MLTHPSNCVSCQHLRKLTIQRLVLEHAHLIEKIAVQTWCRKCGMPVLLEVLKNYEYAKRHFMALDDQPMVHKDLHAEVGGWGMHWRLDEVLATVFPNEHTEQLWPKAPWYEHSESEDQGICVIDTSDRRLMEQRIDIELRMLQAAINRAPKTREELEMYLDRVWDTQQLSSEFEVLGFRAPFAIVKKRSSGEQGSMLFQNQPRFYFAYSRDRLI